MDGKEQEKPARTEAPESVYENFNKVPVKVLDFGIGLCIIALIVVIAAGILNR